MTATDEPTIRIAGYEGFRRVGSGGFSAVYQARQTSLGRDVAVKVLNAGFSTDSDRRIFERECHTMGVLSRHPNIVTVYSEAFTDDGRPCIIMELYRGNYRERLEERGPLAVADLLSLGVKMAGALQSVHDAEILHRDLKPHNLFLSDFGEPALGDFGISTIEGERSITGTGGLSVAYAAPEVLEDSISGPSADIYSLGATLYHLLDGVAPFSSGNIRTTIGRILTEDPPVPNRSDVPIELVGVLHRALAKQSGDRFASALELARGLRDVQASIGLPETETPLASDRLIDAVNNESVGRPSESPRFEELQGADDDAASETLSSPPTKRPSKDPPPAAPISGPWQQPARSAPSRPGPSRPGRAFPPQAGELDSPIEERTIARAGTRHAHSEGDAGHRVAPDEPSPERRRTAVGLGIAALFVVVVGVAALSLTGGGNDAAVAPPSTPVEVDEPDDDFLAILLPPAGTAVSVGDDGDAMLRFDPVEGAIAYEATSVAPSRRAGLIRGGDGSPLVTDVPVEDAPCWEVVALGEAGRSSRPAAAVCLDE